MAQGDKARSKEGQGTVIGGSWEKGSSLVEVVPVSVKGRSFMDSTRATRLLGA